MTRRLGLGLAVAAVAAATITVTVLAANDGGPGEGGHVYLWPLAHPFLGVAVAGVLLATAAWLGVQHQARRLGAQTVAVLVVVGALGLGSVVHELDKTGGLSDPFVVTTSADLAVVSYWSGDVRMLRLRTREGLPSREGTANVACFAARASGVGPAWTFGRAEVTGRDEITAFTDDGTAWPIRFDRRTLSAASPLDRCTGAPKITYSSD